MDKGIKFIVVDYLQLMHGKNRENRVQEVSEISQGLKKFSPGIADSDIGGGPFESANGGAGDRDCRISRESGVLSKMPT